MPHLRIREIMDSLAARGNLEPADYIDIAELVATCLAPRREQSGGNAPDSYEAMFPTKAAKHSFEYRQRQKNLTKPDEPDGNLTKLTLKEKVSHTLPKENNINIYTRAKTQKGSRLPENWQPSLETLSYLDKLGCSAAEITSEAENFRLWAYSASGQVSIKRDWESAFKGWMRREKASGKVKAWGNKSTGKVLQGSFRKELPPEPPRKPRTAEEQAEIDAKLRALMRVKRP